ncbi:MAG: transposase [Patescibacteria group bacterium]
MPKREKFVPGCLYHIYNRAVEKRSIFLDNSDYLRAIHNLFEFNNETPATNSGYLFNTIGFGNQYTTQRKPLVDILVFCLMPNHFHLLLKPRREGGLELFMRKFGAGYANYFNLKYKRSGALFEGRYKSILIEKESHLIHLPFYIHLNPLDLSFPSWRTGHLKNHQQAMSYLESYRWSSYLDYIGKHNFPSVTQRNYLMEFFNGPANYKQEMESWLKSQSAETMKDVLIEHY